MKKYIFLLAAILTTFSSCEEKDCCVNIEPVNITLNFSHNWDGTTITSSDFSDIKYTNANGELLSIERYRYLISKVTLTRTNDQSTTVLEEYQLVNLGENTGLQIAATNIPQGKYKLSFTFGFSDDDNQDGVYPDLNTANFNVPGMLGGGYHYMQFDGKYKDSNNQDANFNYHAIRAVDNSNPNNLLFEDTSFEVDLGIIEFNKNTNIEVEVNIAEWFKNPNTWDLNQLNTVLMPNLTAQKMMNANGKSVFSLGEITQ